MPTEFEFSARFVCWGDQLEPLVLADAMGIDVSLCTARLKGDLLGDNDKHAASYAKTGMLTYSPDKNNKSKSHDPIGQLEDIAGALDKASGSLGDKFNVEKSELQIFIFYGAVLPGEPEFIISNDLLMKLFGGSLSLNKDSGQRIKNGCGCNESVDIGSYSLHPCYHNCLFCYANPASG